MTDKKQLRKELIAKRKKMTDEEFSKKSLRICNRLLNNSQYLKSKVIYCYYSVNKEVDLLPFIKQALEDGKIIAFPKVKGQNMDFFEVKSLEELEPGYFNIPEPPETRELFGSSVFMWEFKPAAFLKLFQNIKSRKEGPANLLR